VNHPLKQALKSLAVAALLLTANAAHADITVYTSQTSFLAALSAPGVDTFDDLTIQPYASPLARTAGSYSYTASTVLTPFFYGAGTSGDGWLSTNTDTVTFANFSSDVRGIGGQFFGSNIFGAFAPGASLTLTATDASGTVTQTLLNATTATFLGFVSDGALTSMTLMGGQQAGTWPTVNNLTLGAAAVTTVPEAQTWAILLAGLGVVALLARRSPATPPFKGHLEKPTAQPTLAHPLLNVHSYASATQRDIGLARDGFSRSPKAS
jgi:hypothetical protein